MPARADAVTDPALAAALLLARRGQAYFSRTLRDLADDDLDAPSLVPGWTRRHVVAHVGLNARAVARLVTWAATGVETPMYDSPTQREVDIALSATLPVQALRHLSDHAAVHLTVEWRDLPEDRWAYPVRTAQGRTVPVSQTVWMRTREVWIHSVDLDSGASFTDFPPELTDALLADVVTAWRRRRGDGSVPGMSVPGMSVPGIVLVPTDGGPRLTVDEDGAALDTMVVSGTGADLARWATGRGTHGVHLPDGSTPPPAPRWL